MKTLFENSAESTVTPTFTDYRLHGTLATLLDRLDSPAISDTDVIQWGCPVLSFGDLSNARVATLGLNPSNREFVDDAGGELEGTHRRFHTLKSLGLSNWADVDARHLRLILESCIRYFSGNPYDRWFRRLDQIVLGTKASYYDATSLACHLDLIPYATSRKWTELTPAQRFTLLDIAADTLAMLLRDSSVRILILNGQSVVERFQDVAGVPLDRQEMPDWSLSRSSGPDVMGFAYRKIISTLSGIELSGEILVLGFNHNIQSSFGVTNEVILAIRDWISRVADQGVT